MGDPIFMGWFAPPGRMRGQPGVTRRCLWRCDATSCATGSRSIDPQVKLYGLTEQANHTPHLIADRPPPLFVITCTYMAMPKGANIRYLWGRVLSFQWTSIYSLYPFIINSHLSIFIFKNIEWTWITIIEFSIKFLFCLSMCWRKLFNLMKLSTASNFGCRGMY